MSTWEAKPHTLAKIMILRRYLDAWFPIIGQSSAFVGKDLFYVDGFAGPGRYTGGEAGSPLTAILSAGQAVANTLEHWKAGSIHCIFVESDLETANSLKSEIAIVDIPSKVRSKVYVGGFDKAINLAKSDYPSAFGTSPLFVFLDPFGPSGLSFATVSDVLASPSSEVLLHFDSDGAARMIAALEKGFNSESRSTLTRVFGDEEWTQAIVRNGNGEIDFSGTTRSLLKHYVAKVRTVANFAYPFQMITPGKTALSEVGYYLIFATQHSRGVEEMKRVMKTVGQDGQYRFSNFRSQRPMLFIDDDDVASDSELLWQTFSGRKSVSWQEIQKFTLNDTRFPSPKGLLRHLERAGKLFVNAPAGRKVNTYPPKFETVISFDFRDQKGHVDG